MTIETSNAQISDGYAAMAAEITPGQYVMLTVRDTGVGMASEVQDKIFDPFYSTKEVGKGTGLGLSISQGIIEKHSGKLTVESKVGKGTEFVIIIPKTK